MERKVIEAYKDCDYKLNYHGSRNVQVLKDSLDQIDGETYADIYGQGTLINDFEEKMALMLGKESAVFYPSGTMAQQIALRLWCDEVGSREVAYHPLCHLEIHEQDGIKELHQIHTFLLGEENRLLTIEDIKGLPTSVKVLLIELPQREIGGQVPSFDALVEIRDYCLEKGIRMHLDGARLLEVLPYYQKTAPEITTLFDSVYISLYKGINGVAGAILAGPKDFAVHSKVWKRRYGGDLISLYPYILAADHHYELRKDKFVDYYELCRLMAYRINQCPHMVTEPKIPVSNMCHVHMDMPLEQTAAVLEKVYSETGIGLTPSIMKEDENTSWFAVTTGDALREAPSDVIDRLFDKLKSEMEIV